VVSVSATDAADPGLLPERITARLAPWIGASLAGAIAHELALLTFALLGWRMCPRAGPDCFTVHIKSDWNVVALGLGLLIVVESLPVHLALRERSPILALTLPALSVYGLLWLIGDHQALRLRPCRLAPDALLVRVGLRWTVRVPRAAIAAVRTVRGDAPSRRERGYLRATVFGDPLLLLELATSVAATGPYGMTRRVRRIGLSPDQPQTLIAALGVPPG